jgi:hypothetical protein
MTFNRPAAASRAARTATAAVAALILLMATSVNTAAADPPQIVQKTDVLGQGGDGSYQGDGARLVRGETSLRIKWQVPTPVPGTYRYPTADQVPPGAPTHPEIIPGWPEVFTLWVFVFNHPELCTAPCNFDDIGDTPAQGGIYQADGMIAHGNKITMRGDVAVGAQPLAGVALTAPTSAEVHVAMTSHGKAYTGDALARQLSIAVGSPAEWWPALFPQP